MATYKLKNIPENVELGQKVFFVKSKTEFENVGTCKECNGQGRVIADYKGQEVRTDCPKCTGHGCERKWTKTYIVHSGFVSEITNSLTKEGMRKQFFEISRFSVQNHATWSVLGGEIFKTKIEAQQRIEELKELDKTRPIIHE